MINLGWRKKKEILNIKLQSQTKVVGKVVQLNSSPFQSWKKRVFSYINVLINIGPGVGGGRKRRGKKGDLPNTFDDDCMARR